MDIGKQIKYYRNLKNVKQEELADYLGVSFQAVSKWETGASVPDISLLPKLAVYFGITIDEMFKMPNEAQFERIENMVQTEHEIEDNTFRYFEKFLTDMTMNPDEKERALTDLACVFNHRATDAHKKAAQYAKAAFELNPESHDAWAAYLEAANGVCGDEWYDNHFEVIQYFKTFLEKQPDNYFALYGIIENLLADGDYDEALSYIEALEKSAPHKKHMVLQYRGDVAFGKGDTEAALASWLAATQTEPKHWQAFCDMGDNLKKLGRYDEALQYYEESFTMQASPRISDGLYSIAQIEERLGHYEKAIEAHKRIIKNLNEDYGVTKDVEIDTQKQEIARLKKLCK